MKIRQAPCALQIVRRRAGDAASLYRRSLDAKRKERLTRIVSISPLAFAAGAPLLRAAVRATRGGDAMLRIAPGPFFPLDPDWGARVACYALVASRVRKGVGDVSARAMTSVARWANGATFSGDTSPSIGDKDYGDAARFVESLNKSTFKSDYAS